MQMAFRKVSPWPRVNSRTEEKEKGRKGTLELRMDFNEAEKAPLSELSCLREKRPEIEIQKTQKREKYENRPVGRLGNCNFEEKEKKYLKKKKERVLKTFIFGKIFWANSVVIID